MARTNAGPEMGTDVAGRTTHPSLYATAEITGWAAFKGEYVRVLAQNAQGHEAATEFLVGCPDGIQRWLQRDELALCL